MSSRSPTPVRFESSVAERLASFVAARPGLSQSSAANRLVDEGLRMAEFPGVAFRDGASGRRAFLVGGPDVWEVVRAVRSARSTEPGLGPDELVALVASNAGLAERLVRLGVAYWGAYPDDVDAEVEAAAAAERSALAAWQRERGLLTG